VFLSLKGLSYAKRYSIKARANVTQLREIEVKIGQCEAVLTACREAGATDKSFYRWRREYGGMKVDQAKRQKQLEQENAALKRLVVNNRSGLDAR
jgi:hypothetical protein